MFQLKERALGRNKCPGEAKAIMDPESGILENNPEKIKEVTLKYCTNLLTNRKPKAGFEAIIENKVKLHNERVKEKIENDVDSRPLPRVRLLDHLQPAPLPLPPLHSPCLHTAS